MIVKLNKCPSQNIVNRLMKKLKTLDLPKYRPDDQQGTPQENIPICIDYQNQWFPPKTVTKNFQELGEAVVSLGANIGIQIKWRIDSVFITVDIILLIFYCEWPYALDLLTKKSTVLRNSFIFMVSVLYLIISKQMHIINLFFWNCSNSYSLN